MAGDESRTVALLYGRFCKPNDGHNIPGRTMSDENEMRHDWERYRRWRECQAGTNLFEGAFANLARPRFSY